MYNVRLSPWGHGEKMVTKKLQSVTLEDLERVWLV